MSRSVVLVLSSNPMVALSFCYNRLPMWASAIVAAAALGAYSANRLAATAAIVLDMVLGHAADRTNTCRTD